MKATRTHISRVSYWRRKFAAFTQTDAKFAESDTSRAIADHMQARGVTTIEPLPSPKRRRSTILTVKR